mmetsp:Transcript_31588/g.100263  ORF Transcript_31588/g.100263 Transcript_31588/m.100263 type:complete len:254 (+) Transcript_31588:171-932(+)
MHDAAHERPCLVAIGAAGLPQEPQHDAGLPQAPVRDEARGEHRRGHLQRRRGDVVDVPDRGANAGCRPRRWRTRVRVRVRARVGVGVSVRVRGRVRDGVPVKVRFRVGIQGGVKVEPHWGAAGGARAEHLPQPSPSPEHPNPNPDPSPKPRAPGAKARFHGAPLSQPRRQPLGACTVPDPDPNPTIMLQAPRAGLAGAAQGGATRAAATRQIRKLQMHGTLDGRHVMSLHDACTRVVRRAFPVRSWRRGGGGG